MPAIERAGNEVIRSWQTHGDWRAFAVGLLCLCYLVLNPAEGSAATAPASMDGDPQGLDLGPYLEVLPDEEGQWTFEDVSGPELTRRFTANTQSVFNAGFTATPYWYRVTLPPTTASAKSSEQWFVEVAFPPLDRLDFYALHPERGWQLIRSGDQEPFSKRPVSHRNFVFPVRLSQGEPTVVYLRVQTQSSHALPLTLLSSEALRQNGQHDIFLLGSYYGLMLGMLLYNALVFLAVRERSNFDYLLVIVFAGLLVPLCLNGLGTQYFWGDSPRWINVGNQFGIFAGLCASTQFTRSFLQLRLRAPRVDRLMSAFQWLAFTAAGLVFVVSARTSNLACVALAPCWALLMLGVASWLFLRGLRIARLYLLAWALLISSVLIKTVQLTGVIATNAWTINSLQFGLAFMVVIFALALADKINIERQERERLGRLKRFFAPEVAAAILVEGGGSLLEAKLRDVTVVFTDLRGFTRFAAQAEPEEIMQVLRQYHEVVGRTVSQHQGTLEHFAGDGVMIIFNAPVEMVDPEIRAVRMTFDLRQQFESLCVGWRQRGHGLGVGIGMASGFATVGAVGWEGRLDYAAIGNVSNLASRLCGQAEHGQILASDRLMSKLDGLAESRDLGDQELKGMLKPVRIYDLVGLNGSA